MSTKSLDLFVWTRLSVFLAEIEGYRLGFVDFAIEIEAKQRGLSRFLICNFNAKVIDLGHAALHAEQCAFLFYGGCRLGGRNVHRNEQINRTRAKSQQIVVLDYSHAYNTLFFI